LYHKGHKENTALSSQSLCVLRVNLSDLCGLKKSVIREKNQCNLW